jgi:hypothetical protein
LKGNHRLIWKSIPRWHAWAAPHVSHPLEGKLRSIDDAARLHAGGIVEKGAEQSEGWSDHSSCCFSALAYVIYGANSTAGWMDRIAYTIYDRR